MVRANTSTIWGSESRRSFSVYDSYPVGNLSLRVGLQSRPERKRGQPPLARKLERRPRGKGRRPSRAKQNPAVEFVVESPEGGAEWHTKQVQIMNIHTPDSLS